MLLLRLTCLKEKKKKAMQQYQARKRNPPLTSLLLYLKWLIHSVNLIISRKYSQTHPCPKKSNLWEKLVSHIGSSQLLELYIFGQIAPCGKSPAQQNHGDHFITMLGPAVFTQVQQSTVTLPPGSLSIFLWHQLVNSGDLSINTELPAVSPAS